MASPGAVAIIETPDTFLLEDRTDSPGKLAYAGKFGLFGGHVDPGEDAYDAVRRELDEEVGLRVCGPLPLLFEGEVDSQNRSGEPVRRRISLFGGIAIGSAAVLRPNKSKYEIKVAEIPRTSEGVEANRDRLPDFTYEALMKAARGELWG